MSGVKKLTSYFKKLTKDEREVEDLLATQLSTRNSRTASIESARTLSTISTAVMSIVDLTDPPSDDLRPALTALADSYNEIHYTVMIRQPRNKLFVIKIEIEPSAHIILAND